MIILLFPSDPTPEELATERRAQSMQTLRDLVVSRASARARAPHEIESVKTVDFDASDRQRLFPCVVHGKVVPTAKRWDCPWCPALGAPAEDEGWSRVRLLAAVDRATGVDRVTGMVALNPS